MTGYSYDSASQLTGINYTMGENTLGNLTYSYDLVGRRTNVGGSFASTGLPQAISTTAYDAANELTQWGTATPTYDLNGNMLSDGTNSYAWNARNQLASMNSGGMGFQYDSFGRRVAKTNIATTANYLYDGANPIQELSGTTPTANLLMGGVDEYFQRTNSGGAASFLSDALGSTVELTNSAGSALAQYAYEPFGNTTIMGSSTNPYQYTGRENDGTGVYFYRGRYYNPAFQRFISEDPIGMAGSGPNLYTYVGNSPVNFSDPTGLWTELDFWQPAGYGESSQGHVSININGTSYSWGPDQSVANPLTRMFNAPGAMDVESENDYITLHNYFRNGTGYILNLTPDQESALADYLDNWQQSPPNYNLFGRNCTAPALNGLQAVGVDVNLAGGGIDAPITPPVETPGILMLQLDATPGLVNGTVSIVNVH